MSDLEQSIQNIEGLEFLSNIKSSSVDLVLTDPPYIISKDSGMNSHYNRCESNEKNRIESVKTQEEWEIYSSTNGIHEKYKDNYIKYGTIYGKKYCVKTDYGNWDSDFTLNVLDSFIKEYARVLKDNGSIIIFFDIWKISQLKELLEKHKFKQIRFIEWIKTNPQPLNSKVNYLTNCREIALTAVKKSKPTFNSMYDN